MHRPKVPARSCDSCRGFRRLPLLVNPWWYGCIGGSRDTADSPATESSPSDVGRQAVRGSRLARRRRVLFWVAGGAALLAIGGLIGSSFVKSPQQIAADTAAPSPTVTTAKVVSQVLTSSVQMRGVVYPATQYDVYPSAPEAGAEQRRMPGQPQAVRLSAARRGPCTYRVWTWQLAKEFPTARSSLGIDGEPLFALGGPVPAWRDMTPGGTGPDVTELQQALASLGYYSGGDTPGFFGAATQEAVSLYYEHLGYTPGNGRRPDDGRDPPAVAARKGRRGERRQGPAAWSAVP